MTTNPLQDCPLTNALDAIGGKWQPRGALRASFEPHRRLHEVELLPGRDVEPGIRRARACEAAAEAFEDQRSYGGVTLADGHITRAGIGT
jgi:hypothetical protein